MEDRHSQLSMAPDMPPLECRSPEVVGLDVLLDLNACAPRAHHLLRIPRSTGWGVQAEARRGGRQAGSPQGNQAKSEQLLLFVGRVFRDRSGYKVLAWTTLGT